MSLVGDGERDGTNGSQICGDILADGAVAARRTARKQPAVILERNGEPVYLAFDRPVAGIVGLAEKLAQLLIAENIRQTAHRYRVRHLFKPVEHSAADPQRRRIGSAQLGIQRLEVSQLAEQHIVLTVRDHRVIVDIVAL